MSLLRSHPYAAALVLLVFGVGLILSFIALGSTGADPTYSMEPYDPNENVEPLRYTPEVRQFNGDTQPTTHVEAVNTAIETGGSQANLTAISATLMEKDSRTSSSTRRSMSITPNPPAMK